MNVLDFFTDLTNPDLAFLPRALAVSVLSASMCGVVGCYVVLRGMAFMGDAVAHSVFPGVAIAFVLGGSLAVGGMIAGVIAACLIALLSYGRRVAPDSVIGIVFVAMFALGVVIISLSPGYSGSLTQFLFGSLVGVSSADVLLVFSAAGVLMVVVAWLHPRLIVVSLDRESARAMGVPVLLLDIALYVVVTLAVVMSIQSIGNVLVLALLVTPAAAARLLTHRLATMMWVAPLIGALSAFIGVGASWVWDLPAGASIVLIATVFFIGAWVRNSLLSAGRLRARASGSSQTTTSRPTSVLQ